MAHINTVVAFEELAKWARENPLSSFYRDHWDGAPLSSLPSLPRAKLAATALRQREYKKKKGVVTIARVGERRFLNKWAAEDSEGNYIRSGKRPLVLVRELHDAVGVSLAIIRCNILPIVGETSNMRSVAFAARHYGIDSFVCDHAMFIPCKEMIDSSYSNERIIERTVFVQNAEESDALTSAHIDHLLLRLPETGVIARRCATGRRTFHAEPGVICECENNEIIATRLERLVTPIIRYATSISAKPADCSCGEKGFTLL